MCSSEQLQSQVRLVQIILFDSEVALGDEEATVIIDMHDDRRRDGSAPTGVVAPSLSEAVAGHLSDDPYRLHRRMDNAPSLDPADGLATLAIAGENKLATPVRKIQTQRIYYLSTQGDGFGFPGFLLCDRNMWAEFIAFLVIYICPPESE